MNMFLPASFVLTELALSASCKKGISRRSTHSVEQLELRQTSSAPVDPHLRSVGEIEA